MNHKINPFKCSVLDVCSCWQQESRWQTVTSGTNKIKHPGLHKWHLGFWSFCILLSRICPGCPCTWLFLGPDGFFVFWGGGEVCPGAGTAAKGPRPQPVSVWQTWVVAPRDPPPIQMNKDFPKASPGTGCGAEDTRAEELWKVFGFVNYIRTTL